MNDYLDSLAAQQAPMAGLRRGLVERAGDLVDAVYRHVHTPIGPILIAATSRGIIRVAFAHETDAVSKIALDAGPRVIETPPATGTFRAQPPALAVLDEAAAELQEYFAGTRKTFEVPTDLRLEGFRGKVVAALAGIDYGQRASYQELARVVGNPGAVRAVGSACANNPIPIFLPCHRVVRSDGTWGNYRGGPEAKTYLLELETAA